MNLPGTILMGAQDRLLDPTIPYRYFATTVVFTLLLWAMIALFPVAIAEFYGGTGPALAALHCLTLGVLAATAIGAALQMAPVATGIPLRSTRAARLASWAFIPGVVILLWGMFEERQPAMAIGGFSTSLGFVVFALLVGEVFWKADMLEPVRRFGLTALAFLPLAIGLGLVLVVDDGGDIFGGRLSVAGAHMLVAVFGFMGMLALGFSHILIPLFSPAEGVPPVESRAAFSLTVLGLGAVVIATFYGLASVAVGGGAVGLAGVALHLRSMRRCLRGGMRKNLGVSALLMQAAWGFLVLGLFTGMAAASDWIGPQGIRLTMFFALFGWLFTFLLAVLQRIPPFLGAMNTTGAGIKPPRPSELAPEILLRIHALLHLTAVALLGLGVGLEDGLAVRLGGIAGVLSALLFAVFVGRVWWLVHGRPHSKTTKETV